MKHMFLAFLLLAVSTAASLGQCGKSLSLISVKTEYLDANGVLQKTEDEKSTIEISKSEIIIVPGNDRKITGTVKSDSCNWKTPFKEGKTIIKALLNREGEEPLNATLTIEGKEGKITMLVEILEMPDRKIRAVIDSFEEKK